jgi:hypothetical protein
MVYFAARSSTDLYIRSAGKKNSNLEFTCDHAEYASAVQDDIRAIDCGVYPERI